jgi:hypothetical protein
MSRSGRAAATVALLAGFVLAPSRARADEGTPSVVSYGFEGFWTGAQVGVAGGYLATGPEYESEEWRKLVFGAGVGALVGTAVGALFLIDDGRPKNLLTGAAIGTLAGAGVGLIFGLYEGATARPEPARERASGGQLRFAVLGSESSLWPLPGVEGSF